MFMRFVPIVYKMGQHPDGGLADCRIINYGKTRPVQTMIQDVVNQFLTKGQVSADDATAINEMLSGGALGALDWSIGQVAGKSADNGLVRDTVVKNLIQNAINSKGTSTTPEKLKSFLDSMKTPMGTAIRNSMVTKALNELGKTQEQPANSFTDLTKLPQFGDEGETKNTAQGDAAAAATVSSESASNGSNPIQQTEEHKETVPASETNPQQASPAVQEPPKATTIEQTDAQAAAQNAATTPIVPEKEQAAKDGKSNTAAAPAQKTRRSSNTRVKKRSTLGGTNTGVKPSNTAQQQTAQAALVQPAAQKPAPAQQQAPAIQQQGQPAAQKPAPTQQQAPAVQQQGQPAAQKPAPTQQQAPAVQQQGQPAAQKPAPTQQQAPAVQQQGQPTLARPAAAQPQAQAAQQQGQPTVARPAAAQPQAQAAQQQGQPTVARPAAAQPQAQAAQQQGQPTLARPNQAQTATAGSQSAQVQQTPAVQAGYTRPARMGVDTMSDDDWDSAVVTAFGYPFINFTCRDITNLLRGDDTARSRAYANIKDQLRRLANLKTRGILGGAWDAITGSPIKLLKTLKNSPYSKCYLNLLVADGHAVRDTQDHEMLAARPAIYGDVDNRLNKEMQVPIDFVNKFFVELNPERHINTYRKYSGTPDGTTAADFVDADNVPVMSILSPNKAKPTSFMRSDLTTGSMFSRLAGFHKANSMIRCVIDGHVGGFIIPASVADLLFAY
jgi:hypothetical protein